LKSLQNFYKVAFCLILLMSLNAQSQNLQGQLIIQTNIGYSFVSNILKTGIKLGVPINTDVSAVSIVNADYGIKDYFSLGGAYSRQSIDGTFQNYDYFNTNLDSIIIENVKFGLTRSHFSILPKYHFLRGNHRLDIYAGLRVGYVNWKTKFKTTDPNFSRNIKFSTGRPSIGLVTGMRIYLIKGFGTNFEINLGAPYVVSVGLNFRFGGEESLE